MAIDCGISPSLFWDMSLDEVTDVMESYRRTDKFMMKRNLILNKLLAEQIMHEILPLLVEKVPDDYKKPELWDYYPELFKDEKEAYEKKLKDDEFEKFKEGRRRFAQYHNTKRGGS